MTTHCQNILLLGGLNLLGAMILAFIPNDLVNELFQVLWFLWVIGALIKLVWTRQLAVVEALRVKFPRLSFFLIAIGWAPYVAGVLFALLSLIELLTTSGDVLAFVQVAQVLLDFALFCGILIGVAYATWRVFYRKNY